MFGLIVAVIVVITGSAICSGSETAILSISLIRAKQLAQSKKPATLALLKIRSKINRPIATVVILNNIFNIIGSIVIGSLAARELGDTLLGIFSGALTFLIIVFGEIVPKTLSQRYAERIAVAIAIPVRLLTVLFTPLVWLVERVTAPFTQANKIPTTNEAEIKFLANIGYQEGVIEDDEAEMIQHVFQLNDLTAADLMSPRIIVTYLKGDLTLAESQHDIIQSQHTRILVIEDSIDRAIGLVLKDQLLTAIVTGESGCKVADLARPIHFVPETIRADKLLKVFQQTREHLAVVLDEYGGVAGVVTLEDVLEVLTGEIVDETDRNVDLQEIARKRRKRLLQSRGIINE
ncbi:hemolysin family protein [Myxosarcina sp. GI1]|uniref:hemolysin family protein n=1 Tax=Myxosarcina sp. GI1 TaxID=1541065 RepID=UPI0005649345|nr:hemolysin family protein [Myxosarcina sp. GI1]